MNAGLRRSIAVVSVYVVGGFVGGVVLRRLYESGALVSVFGS